MQYLRYSLNVNKRQRRLGSVEGGFAFDVESLESRIVKDTGNGSRVTMIVGVFRTRWKDSKLCDVLRKVLGSLSVTDGLLEIASSEDMDCPGDAECLLSRKLGQTDFLSDPLV